MRSPEQVELGLWVLERKYMRWVSSKTGQEVKREVIHRSRKLRERGFMKYGMEAIWNAMRYDRNVTHGPDEDGFKLNNNWKRFLSREIEQECPDLKDFFTKRRTRGET